MTPLNQVLIIVGDASETLDTLYPFYRLQDDGFEPVVAVPEKRVYQMVCCTRSVRGGRSPASGKATRSRRT
jgi:putative intracellular protease/amidase